MLNFSGSVPVQSDQGLHPFRPQIRWTGDMSHRPPQFQDQDSKAGKYDFRIENRGCRPICQWVQLVFSLFLCLLLLQIFKMIV